MVFFYLILRPDKERRPFVLAQTLHEHVGSRYRQTDEWKFPLADEEENSTSYEQAKRCSHSYSHSAQRPNSRISRTQVTFKLSFAVANNDLLHLANVCAKLIDKLKIYGLDIIFLL